jgi:hypothetical protein
MNFQRF